MDFDGIELADYYNPKLTTIKQPARELAIRGVEILFNFIDFHAGSIHETVSVDLITGESVKKLASGGEKDEKRSGVLMHCHPSIPIWDWRQWESRAKQFCGF